MNCRLNVMLLSLALVAAPMRAASAEVAEVKLVQQFGATFVPFTFWR